MATIPALEAPNQHLLVISLTNMESVEHTRQVRARLSQARNPHPHAEAKLADGAPIEIKK
jgi:hypothetical protein